MNTAVAQQAEHTPAGALLTICPKIHYFCEANGRQPS